MYIYIHVSMFFVFIFGNSDLRLMLVVSRLERVAVSVWLPEFP